jgi:hypothetical protein
MRASPDPEAAGWFAFTKHAAELQMDNPVPVSRPLRGALCWRAAKNPKPACPGRTVQGKMIENAAESHTSAACLVSWHSIPVIL